jgi:cobalt-zinc-cadmium efflux system outer membrane protein
VTRIPVLTLVVSVALGVPGATRAGEGPGPTIGLADDPQVAAMVREALERSPEIAREAANVRAERDRVPQAGALPDPTLTLGIQNDGFQSIQIGTMETSYWQVMLTQPIPWPGKLGARGDVARAQEGVADARLAKARLTRTAEVERAYVDLLLVRGQLELLERLDVLWKQAEVMARTRYEVGQGAQSDLLRAQLERTRLMKQRVALESAEHARVQTLNSLRVHPLDEPVPTPRSLRAIADPALPLPDEAMADAERRSPDLAISARNVAAADRRVDSAKQDWFPDLSVSASVMPRGQIEPMWALQLGVTLPVYGASKQSKAVSENVSRREAEIRDEDATRLLVQLRARERQTLLAAALRTLEIYRSGLLVQSDATVRSTLAQYQVGKVTFPSVLEVLRGLVADEGGYLDSLAETQRVAIDQREVSLAPPAGLGGVVSSGAVPGAGGMGPAGKSPSTGASTTSQAASPAMQPSGM